MKLTKKFLKQMIVEVIKENKQRGMLLTEMSQEEIQQDLYEKVVTALEGANPNVRSAGVMSGQNPMVTQVSAEENRQRDEQLKQRLDELDLAHDTVGGVFGGFPEDSVVIYNPTRQQMISLSEEFQQGYFAYGELIPEEEEGGLIMTHEMYKYDETTGKYAVDPYSKKARHVIRDEDLQGVTDNYSHVGGKKFNLPLYEARRKRGRN